MISHFLLFTVHCFLLAACFPITRPTLKIGLVAPFEGRYREVGYEVIYAVRLAVREANTAGGVGGYSVELVSLDDSGDPEMAPEQARKLAADPQVLGVIGHWLDETTVAAASEYAGAGEDIPMLTTVAAHDLPPSTFQLGFSRSPCAASSASICPQSIEELRLLGQSAALSPIFVPAPLPADSTDPAFANRYRAISNGVEPRFNAVLAYDAARVLLEAIRRDGEANETPTRAGVAAALAQTHYSGLGGMISFDLNHNWAGVQTWIYQWRAGELVKP